MIANHLLEEKDYSAIDEDIMRKCESIQKTYGDAELANFVRELLFVFYHSRDGLYVVNSEGESSSCGTGAGSRYHSGCFSVQRGESAKRREDLPDKAPSDRKMEKAESRRGFSR